MSKTPIKLNNGNVLIAGVEYKIMEYETGGKAGCDVCDAQYSNCWCRGGGGNCDLNHQYYKVVDDRKMIKANNVYENNGVRYISFKGECTNECAFFKKNGCKLHGLACKGYTPLKPMYKGGI